MPSQNSRGGFGAALRQGVARGLALPWAILVPHLRRSILTRFTHNLNHARMTPEFRISNLCSFCVLCDLCAQFSNPCVTRGEPVQIRNDYLPIVPSCRVFVRTGAGGLRRCHCLPGG